MTLVRTDLTGNTFDWHSPTIRLGHQPRNKVYLNWVWLEKFGNTKLLIYERLLNRWECHGNIQSSECVVIRRHKCFIFQAKNSQHRENNLWFFHWFPKRCESIFKYTGFWWCNPPRTDCPFGGFGVESTNVKSRSRIRCINLIEPLPPSVDVVSNDTCSKMEGETPMSMSWSCCSEVGWLERSTISSARIVLSEMSLPWIKVIWLGEISYCASLLSLLARIFVKILHIRFTHDMGQKSDNSEAVVDFGIRVRKV